MTSREWDWTSRISRAFSQRIYLLEAEKSSETNFRFKVMGNSGQSYNVEIKQNSISCSCPDHMTRDSLCKHLLFVLIRACRIAAEDVCDSYYRNRDFRTTERTLEKCTIFMQRRDQGLEGERFQPAQPGPAPALPSNRAIPARPVKPARPEVERKPLDDCCPVCYEEFADTKNEPTVWCRYSCGNSLHSKCFDMWSQSLKRKYQPVNCVYCRAKWE